MTFEEKLKQLLKDDGLVELWVERAAIIEFDGEETVCKMIKEKEDAKQNRPPTYILD